MHSHLKSIQFCLWSKGLLSTEMVWLPLELEHLSVQQHTLGGSVRHCVDARYHALWQVRRKRISYMFTWDGKEQRLQRELVDSDVIFVIVSPSSRGGKSTLILMLSKYWKFPIALLFYFIWLGSWQNVTGIYESKLFLTRRRHLLYFEKYFSEKKKEFMFEVIRTILKVCSLANIFIGKK